MGFYTLCDWCHNIGFNSLATLQISGNMSLDENYLKDENEYG